jgi:nitrite reductase/ring-hydroxylating ferredoxin subunit
MLGPLERGELLSGGIIECPWHGYRFDLRTRACVSGARCALAPAPAVHVDPATSDVTLIAAAVASGDGGG